MKRRILGIMMIAAMLLAGGCGNKETEAAIDTTVESGSEVESEADSSFSSSTETVESSVEVKQEEAAAEPEPVDVNSLITEKTDEELDLKNYIESYEDRSMDEVGSKVFNIDLFDTPYEYGGLVTATGNIDIYNVNGIRIGYAVSGAQFSIFGSYEGWYYFYLGENRRFARVEDVDANIKTNKQIAEEKASEEAARQEQPTVNAGVPVENVPVEPPVEAPPVNEPVESPVETDTYTAEQAIADYRAIMEANGITWDPSIKEFASWGTGMLPLNKAEVEAGAYSSVESFAIGNHGGNSWTKYYLEVTGSDENYVYVTSYGCD